MLVFRLHHVSMHCVLVRELKNTSKLLCRDSELNITSCFVSEVLQSNNVCAVPTDLFYRKCVLIEAKAKNYVIPLPNNIERD